MAERPGGGRTAADFTALVLGIATLVSGAATGLFLDLPDFGKGIGTVVFALWILAIGLVLWTQSFTPLTRWTTIVAFGLTAILLVYAFFTGPRLNDRTLLLDRDGARAVDTACRGAVATDGSVQASIALEQLDQAFVHIEVHRNGCEGRDSRLRADDLRAVLPKR